MGKQKKVKAEKVTEPPSEAEAAYAEELGADRGGGAGEETSSEDQYVGRNILDSVYELADIIKSDPTSVEKTLLKRGDELISVFTDPTYSIRRFPDLNDRKVEVLEKAIEDVAVGVLALRSSVIGLINSGGTLVPYVTPHGTNPEGDVVFNVKWKNTVAFKNWRREDGTDDVSQEDVNAAIYKLTVDLAKCMD